MSTNSATALTIYNKIADPIAACTAMAKPIASLCQCSIDQAAAIMLSCLCEGITPFEFQKKYHLIQGKPTMKAAAMLAEFRSRYGGQYKIIERSSERAAIMLTTASGEKYEADFTWADAQASRWPWGKGHGPGSEPKAANLKDNWSTPTDRKSMLWARLVRDSVDAVCPEITAGIYTPEEIQDLMATDDTPAWPQRTALEAAQQLALAATEEEEEVIDASFEVVADPEDTSAALGNGYVTASQIERIRTLFTTIGLSHDKQLETLKKRKVNSVRSLTTAQGTELIDRLEAIARSAPKN